MIKAIFRFLGGLLAVSENECLRDDFITAPERDRAGVRTLEYPAPVVSSAPPLNIPPGEGVYEIVNSEMEICLVDTRDPRSPFYGRFWDTVCRAFQEQQWLAVDLGERVYSKAGYPQGFQVWIGNVRGFLPISKCRWRSRTSGSGRVIVRVAELNPHQQHLVFHELPAGPSLKPEEADNALVRLEKAKSGRQTIKGTVLGLARHRDGQPAGLIVECLGLEVYVAASHALGLCGKPEESLAGLPVALRITGLSPKYSCYFGSLKEVFQQRIERKAAPRPNGISPGLVLCPDQENLLVLLPERRLGLWLPKPGEDLSTHCGRIIDFMVMAKLPDASLDLWTVRPCPKRKGKKPVPEALAIVRDSA